MDTEHVDKFDRFQMLSAISRQWPILPLREPSVRGHILNCDDIFIGVDRDYLKRRKGIRAS